MKWFKEGSSLGEMHIISAPRQIKAAALQYMDICRLDGGEVDVLEIDPMTFDRQLL